MLQIGLKKRTFIIVILLCFVETASAYATIIYAGDAGENTLSQITSAGVVSPFATGVSGPYGLAVDGSGNVYANDYLANTISTITPAGVVSFFAAINGPYGLAIDNGGIAIHARVILKPRPAKVCAV